MRIPPRIALVPLAVLISVVPFTFSPFVGPAGADSTAADTTAACEEAFSTGPTSGLTFTHEPVTRLAYSRQTVRLSGAWDPAAWESLSSALACVRVDDTFDGVLGVLETAPANGGVFEHSFVIPDSAPGTRLCTRIRIDGDPAGEATDATWVTKQHCYEVDHHMEQSPPSDDETTPTTSAPTTTTTAPATVPASSSSNPGDGTPPQVEAPAPPFDSAGEVPPPGAGTDTPAPAPPTTPEYIPLLPATGAGAGSLGLLRYGELAFFTGLALLVLFGRPRRRRQTA